MDMQKNQDLLWERRIHRKDCYIYTLQHLASVVLEWVAHR